MILFCFFTIFLFISISISWHFNISFFSSILFSIFISGILLIIVFILASNSLGEKGFAI